jgi:hypothetical protein
MVKMARAFIDDAIVNGCRSWDIKILKLLGVVLQCACASRSGDIARSEGYTGLECLLYEDITLALSPGGSTVQDLRGEVVLKYEKAHKYVSHGPLQSENKEEVAISGDPKD